MQKQPTKWQKIFTNHIFHKRLISKIYKELKAMQQQKKRNPIKTWGEDLNRSFSKEDVKDGQWTLEKMLNITNHRGNANQSHNEIGPHFSSTKMPRTHTGEKTIPSINDIGKIAFSLFTFYCIYFVECEAPMDMILF